MRDISHSKADRSRLHLLAALVAAPLVGHAQAAYPSRPVTLIVPSAPGGASDIAGRLIALHMSRQLGQPVIVENKVGASGMLAMSQLAKSAPDGYTIALGANSPLTTSPNLFRNPGYDPITSFAPLGLVTTSNFVLVVAPDSRIGSVRQLVELAKAKPGSLTFATSGVNGAIHLLSELFKISAGIDTLHVPFKGGTESSTAVMSGQIDYVFDAVTSVIGLVKGGKLKPLAVPGTRRDAALPDVPTMAELGFPQVTTDIFFGLIAPAKTPPSVLATLTSALKTVSSDGAFKEATLKSGAFPMYASAQEFQDLIVRENERWRAVIQRMGVVPQ
jgi:tripartite-type tricarboxylate transporter receptor subunit TctC